MGVQRRWLSIGIASLTTGGLAAALLFLDGEKRDDLLEERRTDQITADARAHTTSLDSEDTAGAAANEFEQDIREVQVLLRDRTDVVSSLPKSLATELDALKHEAVNGDILAAKTLYEGLQVCSSFIYDTKEEFDVGMEGIQETQSYKENVRGEIVEWPVYPGNLEHLTDTFVMCDGLSESEEAEFVDWLRHAADLGDPESAFNLGAHWLGNTSEGRSYLKQAWDAGWYPAARPLAVYSTGAMLPWEDVTGQSPDDLHTDHQLAYAYLYAYAEVIRHDKNPESKFVASAIDELRQLGLSLAPREQALGEELGRKLLEENKHCCISTRQPKLRRESP